MPYQLPLFGSAKTDPMQDVHLTAIKELPPDERPANRIVRYGPTPISTAELLAIQLGTSGQLHTAQHMLAEFGGLYTLAKANTTELTSVPGIGPATAARLHSAFELGRRLLIDSLPDTSRIRSPADGANLIMSEMSFLDQEEMWILILGTKNNLLHIEHLYKGSLNTSLIRVGEVFREPIRRAAASIIVAHNHPSGDPAASPEDVAVTRQIVEAGKLLDIDVLDHLIIGHQRFVSMKERGLGF